jgi:hypothetical protein
MSVFGATLALAALTEQQAREYTSASYHPAQCRMCHAVVDARFHQWLLRARDAQRAEIRTLWRVPMPTAQANHVIRRHDALGMQLLSPLL